MTRTARVDVRKTYKLYIGGQFPRSESGHSYVVDDAKGRFVANAALASRKDARDAVLRRPGRRSAAGAARPPTTARRSSTASPRSWRTAARSSSRPSVSPRGSRPTQAGKVLDLSIDRLVWYAGWADKITQVTGNANPVAGPFFNLSTPEPTGVVGVVAPQQSSLLGLVSVVAPVVVTGNTAVVLSSYERPLPAVTFSEVLATSDVPGGVVNILTGRLANTAPTLASHMDVNAIDLTGFAGDTEQAQGTRGGRCREPQACAPPAGHRARLDARARHRADDHVPGDQDRLAPDRRLKAAAGSGGRAATVTRPPRAPWFRDEP